MQISYIINNLGRQETIRGEENKIIHKKKTNRNYCEAQKTNQELRQMKREI
jgi:hypothetical protein